MDDFSQHTPCTGAGGPQQMLREAEQGGESETARDCRTSDVHLRR